MYSTRDVAELLKKVLTLRISGGYSHQHIAHYLRVEVKIIEQTEKLAVEVVRKAIEDRKLAGIPIIGGRN
jgi:hypothetical protein